MRCFLDFSKLLKIKPKNMAFKPLPLALLLSMIACNPTKTTSLAPVKTSVPAEIVVEKTEPKVSTGPNSRVICQAGKNINNDPRTIEDLIKLLNSLPKPTTVACMMDALKGPFKVNATSNTFSGQPAFSSELPRIFLRFGTQLFVAVVPRGEGGKVVEVSYLLEDGSSVKGELHFPLTEVLSADAAYTSILGSTKRGTVCSSCHFPESLAGGTFPKNAYSSFFFVPMPEMNVTIATINKRAKTCASEAAEECPVLEALFQQGMPTAFQFEAP
jgi:hypothetical protein